MAVVTTNATARMISSDPFRVTSTSEERGMATGETGFEDVTYDLISVQYHALKAGHDYGQYVRDAKNAGMGDIASFFEQVMAEDSARAKQCHAFIKQLSMRDEAGPAAT